MNKQKNQKSRVWLIIAISVLAVALLGLLVWAVILDETDDPTESSATTAATPSDDIPVVSFDPTYPSDTKPEQTGPEETEPDLPETHTMRLVTDVTVRREPDAHAKDDGTLLAGNEIQVVSYDKDWITILLGTELRYIPAGTVREVGKYLVVIDPGHQAKANYDTEPIGPNADEEKAKVTSGTQGVSTGLAEYKLNLTVALKLRDILEARGYQVMMTRTTHNVDISNAERAEIANSLYADCFIRIHANGSSDKSVNGVETICQTSENPYNADIYEECLALSNAVLDEVVAATGAVKRYVWKTDTMSGINWCQTPVTIVEMGYMSNAAEDELMATDAYQDKLAQGIANGIDAYFAQLEEE